MALFIFWPGYLKNALRYFPKIVDVSIVNKTSPENNWNRQAGRQAGGLTKLGIGRHAPPKIIREEKELYTE